MPNTNGLIECTSVQATGDPASSSYVGKALTFGTIAEIDTPSAINTLVFGGDLATFTFEPGAIYEFNATFLLDMATAGTVTYGSLEIGPSSIFSPPPPGQPLVLSYGGTQFVIPVSIIGAPYFISLNCALSSTTACPIQGTIRLSTPANVDIITPYQVFIKRIA